MIILECFKLHLFLIVSPQELSLGEFNVFSIELLLGNIENTVSSNAQ